MAPERIDVAEDHRNRQSPGDGAERQEVATQAQGEHADGQGGESGQQQREHQAQPRRESLRRRQPGGRIGGDADEGCLPERGGASDARQQHQSQRHQGADADVVE
jgi:hypothetical protein